MKTLRSLVTTVALILALGFVVSQASDTTLNRFVARGTTAQRTAFTPSVPTPASGPSQGYLFWDTDLQAEYAWDVLSAAWVAVGGGGSGTVTNTGALASGAIVKGNGGVDVSTTTTGTGVLTALGVNVGTDGAFVAKAGALGTPSSGVATNLTGLPATTGLVGVPGNICEGRLTTETGVPVSTADRTAQGTIYFTPSSQSGVAIGTGLITLYNGTTLVLKSFTELSLALTATSGKNYDVFVDYNAGTPQLVLSAEWTNDTTRADALATQAGIVVKSGTAAYRWVGTIRASGANVTADSGGIAGTSQTGGQRFVWNVYNQVPRQLSVLDTTGLWAYTTGTWRQANGAAGNKVEYVSGAAVSAVDLTLVANWQGNNQSVRAALVSLSLDSVTVPGKSIGSSYNGATALAVHQMSANYAASQVLGYHYVSWMESGSDGTGSFNGSQNSAQSGINGTICN